MGWVSPQVLDGTSLAAAKTVTTSFAAQTRGANSGLKIKAAWSATAPTENVYLGYRCAGQAGCQVVGLLGCQNAYLQMRRQHTPHTMTHTQPPDAALTPLQMRRLPEGEDATLSNFGSTYANKVNVYTYIGTTKYDSEETYWLAAMGVGGSYTHAASGLVFRVASLASGTATVTVCRKSATGLETAATCTGASMDGDCDGLMGAADPDCTPFLAPPPRCAVWPGELPASSVGSACNHSALCGASSWVRPGCCLVLGRSSD